MKTLLILMAVLVAGCATMGEIIDVAKVAGHDAAIAVAAETEAKLAAVVEEKTGRQPGTFTTSDGSTDWTGLLASGPAAFAAYLGWRRVRKWRESAVKNGEV